MRTIWNGSINFGLVNIPVGLALATKPAARQSDVSFRTLHRECGTPIKQKRWCPVHDREVPADELVKGWEVAKGEFVFVEDEDLEAIMVQDDSRAIEITRFVPFDQVDPVFYDRTYYLAPASAAAQRRPYVLLLRAMQETGMGAQGRFILRGQENFCLIRPRGDALALETLFVAEDVRSQAEIEEAVGEADAKDAELELARQVIDSLAGEFDPDQLVSEYRSDLRTMLEAKLAGEEVKRPEPVAEDAPVIDLMEALRQSVSEAQKEGKPAAKAKSGELERHEEARRRRQEVTRPSAVLERQARRSPAAVPRREFCRSFRGRSGHPPGDRGGSPGRDPCSSPSTARRASGGSACRLSSRQLIRATKKPAARRRHGLEGSHVGWAAHHSLSSLIDTL